MSRVESASGNEGSAADRAAFREVQKLLGQAFFAEKAKFPPSEVFGPLLHAPRAALELIELGGALRSFGEVAAPSERSLSEAFVEFVAFVVFAALRDQARAQQQAFAYRRPMFNHLPRAVGSGVRPEAIRALLDGADDALRSDERELAEFVRAVLAGSMDDRCWSRTQDRLGPRRTIETVCYALLDSFFCRLESALGLRDATEDELGALVEQFVRSHGGSAGSSLWSSGPANQQ